MPSALDSGASGKRHSLDHLYARSLDDGDDRFNTRNGVFYPTGYALLAIPDECKLSSAIEGLANRGVPEEDLTLLRPEQMRQLTDQSQRDAGVLARVVSAELKQMAVLEQLADAGNQFVLVKNTDRSRKVLESIGVDAGASKGLLFHTLAMEELPVKKETIPGNSPFGVNEVIRTQESDADMSGKHRP